MQGAPSSGRHAADAPCEPSEVGSFPVGQSSCCLRACCRESFWETNNEPQNKYVGRRQDSPVGSQAALQGQIHYSCSPYPHRPALKRGSGTCHPGRGAHWTDPGPAAVFCAGTGSRCAPWSARSRARPGASGAARQQDSLLPGALLLSGCFRAALPGGSSCGVS